jgi:hypothetical protein
MVKRKEMVAKVMRSHSTIYVWQFLSHYFDGNLVKYAYAHGKLNIKDIAILNKFLVMTTATKNIVLSAVIVYIWQ